MFQNKVATSRITLPITIVYGVIMLLLSGVIQEGLWLQTICIAITTNIMVIINNSNALIRIYSRLVSCICLVLTIMTAFIDTSLNNFIVQAAFALSLMSLFRTYQDKRGMKQVFTSFLFLGIISTLFIQILFLIPILWIILGTRMQASSIKNYAASILALLTPYWFWLTYGLYTNSYKRILLHIASITDIAPISSDILEPHLLISFTFITLLGMCGIVNFIRYSYNDNIKTRMFFNSLITLFLVLVLFMILQPQHSRFLLNIIIITVSPIIAHYFTFTKSWFTNYYFIVSMITALLLTIYNTWI